MGETKEEKGVVREAGKKEWGVREGRHLVATVITERLHSAKCSACNWSSQTAFA